MATSPSRAADQADAATALQVRGLQIESRIGGVRRTIVSNLDLDVAAGETIGIVGESGSGKSITARAIMRLLPAGVYAHGEILYDDKDLLRLRERDVARMRGTEIGLVFQDPFTMLNPLRRCGAHITEMLRDTNGRKLSRTARRVEAERRLVEVGITDPAVVDAYPFQLSGGMRQRVGIASALARDPRVLIADEPSTALDVTTQKEILALLKALQDARGMSLILITHDLRVAFSMCSRIYVLYAGSLLEVGDAAALDAEPLHPYTLGLLLSEPPVDRRLPQLASIPGSVPSPDDVKDSCPFAQRCVWVTDACRASQPPLVAVGAGRYSRCRRLDEIRPLLARTIAEYTKPAAGLVAGSGGGTPLLQITGLTKVFSDSTRRGTRVVRAISDAGIEIKAGESVGLVGESGSGKTTLARCIVGLENPTSGAIRIAGVDAHDYRTMPTDQRKTLRRTVQIIFQDPYSSLNPVRTVGAALREALVVGSDRDAGAEDAVANLLERVGLPRSYAQRKPVALSGGERQRVAIARALAVNPRLIICDEPVSALDVSVQAQILNLFKQLQTELGVAYLFITHDLAVVRQIADRAYVMYQGSIVEQGPVADILDRPQHPYTLKLINSVPNPDAGWLETATPAAASDDDGA
jgi:peptide/nickel transport system ATP-binding protein